MESKKVVVVGAGAAGLMAASAAAMYGASVTLIEKNKRVGRKIMITGKGRCNVCNNCDVETFIRNVPTNGKFLYSAINKLTPEDTVAFFEGLGLSLKTERGNRVFPQSDKAVDVVDTLYNYVKNCGCKIVEDTAEELLLENGEAVGVKCKNKTYYADSVIICCGGKSYPLTGSTGDGYTLAKQVGHTIVPLKPSLVPLESKNLDCKSMQGLSLKNAGLKIVDTQSGKTVYDDFGEMLFTHFGMSGPMVLSASSHIRDISDGRYNAVIDIKPALSYEQLEKRLQRDFDENHNKDVSNSFTKLLPKKLVVPVLKRWGIPFDKKCNSVTKKERRTLCELLKAFTVEISGFRPIEEAIITSGGVKTTEINPKTMESRLVKGLYFAGEVIDCDAYTGGFNLQIAWSTGNLAGESAAYYERKNKMSVAIALDGPAGAGKSTIAKRVAKALDYIYVDTGALYRTIGLSAMRRNIEPVESKEVSDMLSKIKVEIAFNDKMEQIVLLNGEDVSSLIRTPEVSMTASKISAIPEVRAYLLDLQRDMAKKNNVIMDGRDIGTVVLPDAKVKIFLTASPEARAERRYKELLEKGMTVSYNDVLKDVNERDYNDSHRKTAPLKPAEGCVIVDTTELDFEQSVDKIISVIKENV